jgi:hypothetical protein
MTKTIGRFYFKQTSNGNLLGEWSNYGSEPATESADLQGNFNPTIQFEGIYHSTWQENGIGVFSELTITRVEKSKKFDLYWKHKDKSDYFKGQAMLCDKILIGDYSSV